MKFLLEFDLAMDSKIGRHPQQDKPPYAKTFLLICLWWDERLWL